MQIIGYGRETNFNQIEKRNIRGMCLVKKVVIVKWQKIKQEETFRNRIIKFWSKIENF